MRLVRCIEGLSICGQLCNSFSLEDLEQFGPLNAISANSRELLVPGNRHGTGSLRTGHRPGHANDLHCAGPPAQIHGHIHLL